MAGGRCCGEATKRVAKRAVDLFWGSWFLVTLAWFACAIFTTAALKHAKHKSMLTMFANLCIGWPLVAPFALWKGCRPLRAHFGKVLLIAIMQGFEKNLTNASLHSIGASLKTALHGFNVLFTFLLAALLGVDDAARWCVLGCHCKGKLLLAIGLTLVTGGGVVTAVCSPGATQWQGGGVGVMLQLGSGVANAMKFTLVKLLLGGGEFDGLYCDASLRPPSKVQIAFVANPVTGLMGLALLPITKEAFTVPPWDVATAVAFSITGILLLQLRLTELTSPLTVSVLATLHDVAIVLFFLVFGGEAFSAAEAYGFAVSTVGALVYACARGGSSSVGDEDTSSFASSIEQWAPTTAPGSSWELRRPVAPAAA